MTEQATPPDSAHDADPPTGETQAVSMTKHHGLGNDFLVALEPAVTLESSHAVALCHRRTGLGADGLLIANPSDAADDSADDNPEGRHRWQMVLYNADGGRAEISGNGIRCLGQAIARRLKLDPAETHELIIDTDAGERTLTVHGTPGATTDRFPDEIRVRVGMGTAGAGPGSSEAWSLVDVSVKQQVGVDIGNPHLVALVDSVEGLDMALIGPVIEAGYPDGCNVHLIDIPDTSSIRLKVWERGAGVTEACGSGASAAAWAANRLGFVDDKVTVHMPGGDAEVDLTDPDQVYLIGPATYVAEVIVHG